MTVVVTYGESDESAAALAAAVEECRRRGTQLVVADLGGDPGPVQDVRDVLADAGLGVDSVIVDPAEDTVEQVLRIVGERNAVLLVIGLRHRTPVGKLILGSLAQRLLLDAACPVLAVKPRSGARRGEPAEG